MQLYYFLLNFKKLKVHLFPEEGALWPLWLHYQQVFTRIIKEEIRIKSFLTTFPLFQQSGKCPDFIADSKIIDNGGIIDSPHNCIILIEILS